MGTYLFECPILISNFFVGDFPDPDSSNPNPVIDVPVPVPDPDTNITNAAVSGTGKETVPTTPSSKKTAVKKQKRPLISLQNKIEHYKTLYYRTKWQYSKFQLTAAKQKSHIEMKMRKLELKKLKDQL